MKRLGMLLTGVESSFLPSTITLVVETPDKLSLLRSADGNVGTTTLTDPDPDPVDDPDPPVGP